MDATDRQAAIPLPHFPSGQMGMPVLTADLPEPTIYRLVFGSPIVGQTVSVKEHLRECLGHMLFDDLLTEYEYEAMS
jgi:hypothetical protein